MSKQFLNSMYKPPVTTINNNGKRIEVVPDALICTLYNMDTNNTELHIIPNPTIDFYVALTPQPFHRVSIPKDQVRKVTVPYHNRDKEMAASLNLLNEYFNSWKTKSNWEFMNNLKKNPNLYAADTDIEDFYKTKTIIKYGYQYAPSYKMGYADIEVDISEFSEDFAEPDVAPCPIYLITYIDKTRREVFCFILFDPRVKDDIMRIVQNPDAFLERNLDPIIRKENFKYNFNVYETELALIKGFFKCIHECKADFVGWWNMPFDMPTILNRLYRLGCSQSEIADICCHPEVPKHFRYVKYIVDPKRAELYSHKYSDDEENDDNKSDKNKPHPSRLFDWVEIPGYTQFYDQMSTFSCLRNRSLLPSYKLDDIGKIYGGIGKLDLADLGYNIRNVNIKNFEVCLAYNIRDSYVQYAIEEHQHDINNIIPKVFNTRLSKVFSNSIIFKNYFMLDLWNEGQIMGNANKFDFKESFTGAFVARTELLEQFGIDIMGSPSYVFENVIDLDATSLYPSIMITHNIFKSALFGHVVDIEKPGIGSIGKGEGLFEDLQTIDQSIFEVSEQYLNLPSVYTILKDIEATAHKKAKEKLS